MDKRPIGILDSGIGGISILNKVGKLLPHENYVYYADSINNPYGNKTKEQLIKMIDRIICLLMTASPSITISVHVSLKANGIITSVLYFCSNPKTISFDSSLLKNELFSPA